MFKKNFFIIFAVSFIVVFGIISVFNKNVFFSKNVKNISAAVADINAIGWIWSDNIGWVSMSCKNLSSCGTVDYGVSINGNNGNFSGYGWSDNVGWIDFASTGLSYPNSPDYGAKFNKALGTVTGWLLALSGQGQGQVNGWTGWIKTAGSNYGLTHSGCGLVGWAWGSDFLGWLSFSSKNCDANEDGFSDGATIGCPAVGTSMAQYGFTMDYCVGGGTPPSPPGGSGGGSGGGGGGGVNAPTVVAGAVTQSDAIYCSLGPNASLNWTFADSNGDTQYAYQIQVATNSGFGVGLIIIDSGQTLSSSNSYSVSAGLDYNKTYYWRVKVWDDSSSHFESSWSSGSSFITAKHQYPSINFTLVPDKPAINQAIQFTDTSTTYGGSSIFSRLWAFQDAAPSASNIPNPSVIFNSIGNKSISLTVADSDNYTCSKTMNIDVAKNPFKWKEVAPN